MMGLRTNKKSKYWNSSLRQIRRRLLTKENSGVTKETPAASREGRTDRVCRCGLKIRWERPPWCDRRNRRRSSQIYGKSRTRCFQAADDINCQISQDIGNRRRGMQRSANNISNRMKIAQMIVNFGNFMSSILICHCSVFFYLFPWCLLICLCGIVLICSVMSPLFVPVTSFDLSLRCRFDLSLGGVWPNSQVEPRMKWGGCPFPTHWLLAKVFFLLIFSSKVFHRQYWQKIASSFFSFLIGSLKEPINLNIFFDALTY